MKNLTRIDLSRNCITKYGIISLMNALFEAGIKLTDLNLTGTLLKDDGLEELLPFALKMPYL